MRLGFLFGRPTQFEGPFFRHAGSSGTVPFTVLYVTADAASSVYDAELGRTVAWGIDLLDGYAHKTLPRRGRLRWLWRELRRERYDWLIINGYTSWPYLAALVIARMRGIRTGLRIDSVLYNAAGWRRRAVKRVVIAVLSRLHDLFFATGTLTREYLMHFGVDATRIAPFPYTVDTAWFSAHAERRRAERAVLRRHLGIPEAARIVLAIAKFNPREAPWDLLDALEGLQREDVWTVLVGDGELRDALQQHVAAHGLPRVVFTGYVPYAELVGYYAMADLFVHAAANEPWGVSVHEAIACGLPVVASSRVGAAVDLVRQGRNGFVYPWGDGGKLRACLAAAFDTLERVQVNRANSEVLERWNYAAAWNDILDAVRA
jgi:glycosyltransferase involved in cell wall biosynthesis